jgi:hypothetical protein
LAIMPLFVSCRLIPPFWFVLHLLNPLSIHLLVQCLIL